MHVGGHEVSISNPEDLDRPRDKMNDSVLVSSDQGKTWKLYLTVTEIVSPTVAVASSGNPTPTPRYEYNQLMYRLDLSDPRLKPAQN